MTDKVSGKKCKWCGFFLMLNSLEKKEYKRTNGLCYRCSRRFTYKYVKSKDALRRLNKNDRCLV